MLGLMVLTSDDVEFSAGISEPLDVDVPERINDLYRRTAEALPGEPSMMLIFQPLMHHFGGDLVCDALDRASGGTPIFGAMVLDFTTEIRRPTTIFNGEGYRDRLSMLLFSGSAKPKFFLEMRPDRRTLNQNAIVTAMEGTKLISVNNMPAVDYIEKLGLIRNGKLTSSQNAIPVVVDFHDGSRPKTALFFEIAPDGALICGGEFPIGATFSIGSMEHDDVLNSAKKLIDEVRRNDEGHGALLILSCFSRNLVLYDALAEMNEIQKRLPDAGIPYLFMYSGGEHCPLYDESGGMVNGYHNYSIIACLL
jgi:hypothetical protein